MTIVLKKKTLTVIQSNPSIMDLLYNGHLVIADTFLSNRPSNSGHPRIGWEKREQMHVFI